MAVDESIRDDGAPSEQPGGRRVLANVVEGLAVAAQVVVFFGTSVMGLGWGGWTYSAAVAQAVVAFVPLLWLAPRRRPGLMMLVPVASAALTAGLFMAGQALGQTGP